MFYYYIPQLTQVKLLLTTNEEEKGIKLLHELIHVGRNRHNKNLLIQTLVLQAAVYLQEGDRALAKTALNEALLLSKNTKNIRTFLDQGAPMYQLLKEIAGDQPENKQITELLQAFEDEKHSSLKNESTSTGNREKQEIKLSKRELEILLHVSQGYKNDEIASKLFISLDTVKKHLYHSYQKLDVKNRVGAVKKARKLGLIASE